MPDWKGRIVRTTFGTFKKDRIKVYGKPAMADIVQRIPVRLVLDGEDVGHATLEHTVYRTPARVSLHFAAYVLPLLAKIRSIPFGPLYLSGSLSVLQVYVEDLLIITIRNCGWTTRTTTGLVKASGVWTELEGVEYQDV